MDITLFDFFVSREDDDNIYPQQKLQERIYKTSLARYKEIYPHLIEDLQIWCHAENSLANNVGGCTG
jgi:hypothetical protein